MEQVFLELMSILFSDGKNPVYMMLVVVMQSQAMTYILAVSTLSNCLDERLLRSTIVICSHSRGGFLN